MVPMTVRQNDRLDRQTSPRRGSRRCARTSPCPAPCRTTRFASELPTCAVNNSEGRGERSGCAVPQAPATARFEQADPLRCDAACVARRLSVTLSTGQALRGDRRSTRRAWPIALSDGSDLPRCGCWTACWGAARSHSLGTSRGWLARRPLFTLKLLGQICSNVEANLDLGAIGYS